MPQQTSLPTIAERALSRYDTVQAARNGMQSDLAVLASKALSSLHSQPENDYSDVTFTSVTRAESGVVEVLPSRIHTWRIPNTQYYLPDWQQGTYDRDFFTLSLEYTIIEMTARGAVAITFTAFVEKCNRFEYVGVCRGLDELSDPTQATPAKRGDGQDND